MAKDGEALGVDHRIALNQRFAPNANGVQRDPEQCIVTSPGFESCTTNSTCGDSIYEASAASSVDSGLCFSSYISSSLSYVSTHRPRLSRFRVAVMNLLPRNCPSL